MKVPNKYYLDKISNIPFEIKYGLPENVIYNYIKKYRKKLTNMDIIDFFLKEENNNVYDNLSIDDKYHLIRVIFQDDFDLSKIPSPVAIYDFLDFIDEFADEPIFIGEDIIQYRKNRNWIGWNEVTKCRDYTLYNLMR
jgi:hypothetical protein